MAEGHASGELKVWDLSDRAKLKKVKAIYTDLGKVWRVRFIHDGKEMVALNQTGSFRVYDTTSWKVLRKGDSPMAMATAALFAPDGDSVATAHAGGRAIRTSLDTGGIVKESTFPATDLALLTERNGKVYLLSGGTWKEADL